MIATHRTLALKDKLKQYSLLVAPVLAATGMANAQVVYHDISPDIFYKDAVMGDNYTEPISLDLDNDGVFDLQFAVWSSVQSNNGPNKINLVAARQLGGNGNAIMGYTNIFSGSICSTPLPLYCASVLNENELVQPGANFWAIPGSNSLGTLIRYFRNEAPPNNFVGQWNNQMDQHIGFRFAGGDGNMHYGWMRLDVSKSPASVTIKDYAYQSQNNGAIHAGEVGNVGVVALNSSDRFSITSSEGAVSIVIDKGSYDGTEVTVSNLLGQKIFTHVLKSNSMQIDLRNFEAGTYIVTIHSGDEYFSRQVYSR
ncbi:MAG TPA: T9SS type A sorting domain-containing protein [Chitinophagales bacterium]|nr:T9SS type A sorting domain-containing protein [Chitinophagales bacterium]